MQHYRCLSNLNKVQSTTQPRRKTKNKVILVSVAQALTIVPYLDIRGYNQSRGSSLHQSFNFLEFQLFQSQKSNLDYPLMYGTSCWEEGLLSPPWQPFLLFHTPSAVEPALPSRPVAVRLGYGESQVGHRMFLLTYKGCVSKL